MSSVIMSRMLGPKGARWTVRQRPLIKFGMTRAESRLSYRPQWSRKRRKRKNG